MANSIDYGMRVYDPRVGRFSSTDPLAKKYPELTPYQFASNTPIQAIDIDGMEGGSYLNDLNGARSRMQLLTAAVLKLPKSQTATTIHDYLRMHPQQAANLPNSDRVESTEGALFRANVNDPDNIGGQAAYAIANNLHDATVDFKEGNFGSGTLDLLNATTNIVTLTGAGPALGVDVNTKVKIGDQVNVARGMANPKVRAAVDLGNKVHYDQLNGGPAGSVGLPSELQARYPNTQFEFTPRGGKGADVKVIGGTHPSQYPNSTWAPGNNFGDFKPGNTSGTNTFNSDVKSGKLPANTQLLNYHPTTGALQ